jgi:hypothetical protein
VTTDPETTPSQGFRRHARGAAPPAPPPLTSAGPRARGADVADDPERMRLAEADSGTVPWRDWGPYVAERAWGTVREDYSAGGDAWDFFPHDHARSRVYRWNEDGMAAYCDLSQDWVLGLSLWNGADPILKERMFGLSGPQGNHGEDVKEYWWYLDGTPTHSWQTWRYHYPQRAYPYDDLVATNAGRSKTEPEYELVDTGVFDEGRYWVVTTDYAKAGPHDLLMRITVENAGPDEATIHVLPTFWYRNTWSWGYAEHPRPSISASGERVVGHSWRSGSLVLVGDGDPQLLFCDNETNTERLFGEPNAFAYPKDGINDHVVSGAATVNPHREGTKVALHHVLTVPPGGTRVLRVRLAGVDDLAVAPLDVSTGFDGVMADRKAEADQFYAAVNPAESTTEEARVLRQAFAGLLWSKQFFHYDVTRWLSGDPTQPQPPPGRGTVRNGDWRHLDSHEILLMPDPWEYPWFAAWDLAFHCVTLAHVDPEFAKEQLILLLREWYMHPNGQLPAYEWNFSDVNPPVHAWAALRVYVLDGLRDHAFLARVFHKLLINFTWWTNNKQHGDNNLFQGGFMGLDNIAPLDRSKVPPELGYLEQADSTAWMAMYALHLLEMALVLALNDESYEDVATKFFEHYLAIAGAVQTSGLWDETDGYFYDVLHLNDGRDIPVRVRSLVGLVPLVAAAEFHYGILDHLPGFAARAEWYVRNHPELARAIMERKGPDAVHRLMSVVTPERLTRVVSMVFDEGGLLSPYGIRSVSAYHREHPFVLSVDGIEALADYEPAESTTGLFGGNSNWRGPIWFPLNALLVESLRDYGAFAPNLEVEYPSGSGTRMHIEEVADDLTRRLVSIFLPGPDGRRPVHGPYDLLATDPRWKDNIPFHEYFHGDTGAGLGAEHQTGWTALVAHLMLRLPELLPHVPPDD